METTSREGQRHRERAARVALVAVLVVALALFSSWWGDQELHELSRLPDCQRRELLSRTVANLNLLCDGDGQRRLPDFCREQAEIALRLPECDVACERLAHRLLRSSRW